MSFYDLDDESPKFRATQLVEKDPDGSMQRQRVSEHAPGPVADHELLARSVDFPHKLLADGGLNDALFADAFKSGASSQRLIDGWEAHKADVHTRFEKRADARRTGTDGRRPNSENRYVGAVHVTAGELRACSFETVQPGRIRVYDAGHEDVDALHADCIGDDRGLEKHERHQLRVRLMKLAEKRGLFVSPHLSEEDRHLAEKTQIELHF